MSNDTLTLLGPVTPMREGTPPPAADPRRDIRNGWIVAALFFVGFLGWAAVTRLDAAAYGEGQLVVSGQRQTVQHRDGGIVQRILVHDGDRVTRGQLLMTLGTGDTRAVERALASQAIRLLAQRARLESEQLGRRTIAPPAEFASLTPEDRREADLAMALQQTQLGARLSVLAAQRGALGERVAQSGQEGRGLGQQAASAREQMRLIDDQLAALKPLADKGFVAQTRMRDLERARAELQGRGGQYAAGVAVSQGAAREREIQSLEAERSFRERSASDLAEVETRLGDVLPKWVAAREQLARASIRAPATGLVVGLSVFTPGGVVAPGQKLMDVVPERAALLIQARFGPDDVDDLVAGQTTLIKFTGLHDRALPGLEGRLTRVSADSLTDEKTGMSYFQAEVAVPPSQVASIRTVRGRTFTLRPGMPVQVLVPLRKRTALDYALEPLIGGFWSSFREH